MDDKTIDPERKMFMCTMKIRLEIQKNFTQIATLNSKDYENLS